MTHPLSGRTPARITSRRLRIRLLAALLVMLTAAAPAHAVAAGGDRFGIRDTGFVIDELNHYRALVWATATGFSSRPYLFVSMTVYYPSTSIGRGFTHDTFYDRFFGGWHGQLTVFGIPPNPTGIRRHYRLHIEACDGDALLVAVGLARCGEYLHTGVTDQ
jgi:hypothetical protein